MTTTDLDLRGMSCAACVARVEGGQVRGVITLVDQVKPGSAAVIAELTAMGITPMLLTGDGVDVAERRTLRTIRMNLFWAFSYNAAAIPLAAAGLLNPMVSGAAMACSSLIFVGNGLRLKRFDGNSVQDASQASSPGSC